MQNRLFNFVIFLLILASARARAADSTAAPTTDPTASAASTPPAPLPTTPAPSTAPTSSPAAASAVAVATGTANVINNAAVIVPVDDIPKVKEGSVPDVQLQQLLDSKYEFRPVNGSEDLYVTKGSKVDLDFHKQGLPKEDRCFQAFPQGIVDGWYQDKQDPNRDLGYQESNKTDGAYRVLGVQNGTTQILVFRGKTPGKCDQIGESIKIYRVTVTTEDLLTLSQELKALIGSVEGVEIRIVGQQVVIEGQVLIPRDMKRVLAVLSKYQEKYAKSNTPSPLLNLIEISPLSMKLLAQKMEEEIAGGKDRNRDIKVKVVNGRFYLEGNVDKRVDREVAEKICLSYIPEKYGIESKDGPTGTGKLIYDPKFKSAGGGDALPDCVMMVRIRQSSPQDPDPIISVRIDFVTLNRNYLKTFDFRWAPGLNLDGRSEYKSDTGKFLTSFTGTLANLFPKLDTLQKNGHARVLKSASVLVRDGDDVSKGGDRVPAEATLVETLNIAYVIPGTPLPGGGASPSTPGNTPVTTSISIKARSVQGSADKINLGVTATQTEVRDFRQGEPPTTLQNAIKTEVVVPNGESAALGGLIAERRNISNGRDPTDNERSAINLFKLSKSLSFTDEKSQFIIFVTPTKLRSTTEGTEQLKRKFRLRR